MAAPPLASKLFPGPAFRSGCALRSPGLALGRGSRRSPKEPAQSEEAPPVRPGTATWSVCSCSGWIGRPGSSSARWSLNVSSWSWFPQQSERRNQRRAGALWAPGGGGVWRSKVNRHLFSGGESGSIDEEHEEQRTRCSATGPFPLHSSQRSVNACVSDV